MESPSTLNIIRVTQGKQELAERQVVEEYPLRLRVNGRDLATLVCSPHQLNFLLVGFFRLQGFITSLDDILSMGVCSEYGLAELRLRAELPEQLQPTLTSGCGTGISYNLPQNLLNTAHKRPRGYSSEGLFHLMKELHGQAEQYRSHGGIHSASIGDADGLLLYAEDIGRHNTLDRLAGEALFKGIEAQDKSSLFISSIRHKAFLEVQEKGAEAAVTAIARPDAAAPRDLVPFTPTFRADRPFCFVIRHKKTGTVLFMGRYVAPLRL